MTPERQQELFEDKYEKRLGMSYQDWLIEAPETEDQAYEQLQLIDIELKQIQDVLANTPLGAREEIEDEKDRLKLEYDLIEEMFGLELSDR